MSRNEDGKPGDGIRSLKTSSVFRTLNFELYAKPNKYMMAFGCVAFFGCVGYMWFMRQTHSGDEQSVALDHNDELVLRKKRSKWD